MDDILFKAGTWLLVGVVALGAAASAIDHGFAVQMAFVATAALLAAAAARRRVMRGKPLGDRVLLALRGSGEVGPIDRLPLGQASNSLLS